MTHPQSRSTPTPSTALSAAAAVNTAFGLQLGTTTRLEHDAHTKALGEYLTSYLATPGEDDGEVHDLREDANRLLATGPGRSAQFCAAYTHMRARARVLRRLIVLGEVAAGGESEHLSPRGPTRRAGQAAGQPNGTYRVPSGLAAHRQARWLAGTTHRGPGGRHSSRGTHGHSYLHRRPGESLLLSPPSQTLELHARAGTCVHRGTCPVLKISPVVVDERNRVLMLQGRSRVRLPETEIDLDFEILAVAAATLARALGVADLWAQPGTEELIHVEPARADPEDGLRTKVSIRYLYRTHSAMCQFASGAPQVWVPLAEVDSDLAKRVGSLLAEGAE
ncbi:hypothetical protein [Streptomyces sp. AC154]|uniref:hypothetical protein n=1 Tax=Streptomyces sp. AC154 TaxID=3143184 RepID=UPI003F7F172F